MNKWHLVSLPNKRKAAKIIIRNEGLTEYFHECGFFRRNSKDSGPRFIIELSTQTSQREEEIQWQDIEQTFIKHADVLGEFAGYLGSLIAPENYRLANIHKPWSMQTLSKHYNRELDLVPGIFRGIHNDIWIESNALSSYGRARGAVGSSSIEPHIEGKTQIVNGKIIEIQEDRVVLQCLLDDSTKELQVRSFEKEPFIGVVDLGIGVFVEIRIITSPGERRFIYRQVSGDAIKHHFEPENIFEEFIDSPIFNSISSVDEDQL